MKHTVVNQAELLDILRGIKLPTRVVLYTRTKEAKIDKEYGEVYRMSNFIAVLHFDQCPDVLYNARESGIDTDTYFSRIPTWSVAVPTTPLVQHVNSGEYYLRLLFGQPVGKTKTRWVNRSGKRIKEDVFAIKSDVMEVRDRDKPHRGEFNSFVFGIIRLDSIQTIKIGKQVYKLNDSERKAKEKQEAREKKERTKARSNKAKEKEWRKTL